MAILKILFEPIVVIIFLCTLEILLCGWSTNKFIFFLLLSAAIAAEPVSPEVATTTLTVFFSATFN